jgi:(heptosyl)LPS beta-1,4-glucosyltransferase
VHEDLIVDGKVDHLTQHLLHENYQTVNQFVERNMLRYASNEADSILSKGYVFSYIDVLWFPAREFLSRYFAREGYKDGLHGLVLSLLLAAYHLVIFANIWERKNFPQENDIFAGHEVRKESEKIAKEFQYWFDTEEIKKTSNPLKKVFLKTRRKLS